MKHRLAVIIPVIVGMAILASIVRGDLDRERPSLAYCLLMIIVTLVYAVRTGLDHSIAMSPVGSLGS